MGVTKTDFMRGMQCPRMLWLDKHRPERKFIPPETRERLRQGNAFGDEMMGIFGDFVEVREYYPGTCRPNKKAMAAKTRELLAENTPVICEAAFLDDDGNYCAVDILRRTDDGYDLYEVKNGREISEQFIRDAGFQAYLIRHMGYRLNRVYLVYHGEEPYVIREITEEANQCADWVAENIDRLGAVKAQKEEVFLEMGTQCAEPYDCWYRGYCRMCAQGTENLPRCRWCNMANLTYVNYHDNEWGVPCHDDHALYELLILESFQSGLSWEVVLNKRENFRAAYDEFEIDKVCEYGEEKIAELLENKGIIRNRLKIRASIQNSRVFRQIQQEFGSFDAYLWGFTEGRIIVENDPAITTSPLSDKIAKDLKKRGMGFCGSTVIYSYLQAAGIINAHMEGCFCCPK